MQRNCALDKNQCRIQKRSAEVFAEGGGRGDIFRLPLGGGTEVIKLDGKDYVAFDLEWTSNNDTGNNRTIYAAAFVDNHGSQKVLQIADFLSPFWLL